MATTCTVPWVMVVPEHDESPESGYSVWTRGLQPNKRVCWLPHTNDGLVAARHIVEIHNAAAHAWSYRECQGCGMEWFEGDEHAPEKHLSTCPIGPSNGSSDDR
jgi:hypothetical protein